MIEEEPVTVFMMNLPDMLTAPMMVITHRARCNVITKVTKHFKKRRANVAIFIDFRN